MSKKTLIFITLFSLGLGIGLSSCRKERLQTPFTRLIGKWKKTKFATDDNRNGVIDSREVHYVESGVNNEIFFKEDSTGIETTNSSPALNFKWQIVSGASVLVQYSANDTIIYKIVNVSSVDLTFTTESDLGLLWYYYVKQ